MSDTFTAPLPYTDKDGVVEVLTVDDAPSMRALFESGARRFLADPEAAFTGEWSLVAAAFYAEGICLRQEAAAFAVACKSPIRMGGRVVVTYSGIHDRPRCVECSAVTIRLLEVAAPAPVSVEAAIARFEAWLRNRCSEFQEPDGGADAIDLVERAASIYWADAMPGLLVPDVLGIYPSTPVDVETLARAVAGRTPARSVEWRPEPIEELEELDDLEAIDIESFDPSLAGLRERIREVLSAMDIGNLATQRKHAIDRMALIADEYEGHPLASLVIEGAHGLLSVGTLTRDLASTSILVRYAGQQFEALQRHRDEALQLKLLPARKRGQVLQAWWTTASTPSDARPALKALDKYLCLRHDLEPASFEGEPPTYPSPSCPAILWRDEIEWVIEAIPKSARAPDIARVALAVMCLITRRPSRPGHLAHGHCSDVLDLPTGEVVHWVRRRRGGRTVKTDSAVGPFTFRSRDEALPLLRQRDYVVAVSGKNDAPLWGRDERESRRLFREAVKLIGQLCRVVTRDPQAGFYALRHSTFTHRLLELLVSGTLADQRALNALLDEGGHRNASVTMRAYFHLAMVAVRAVVDRKLEGWLTPAVAARWAA